MLGGELLVRASTCRLEATWSSSSRTTAQATYAEKIEPAERRLDPARPAIELARTVRALTPHIGAYWRLAGGERLGVRRARPVDVGVRQGEVRAEWGALLLGCGRGALRLEVVQPAGGRPMAADAYLRGHPLPAAVSGDRGAGVSPARQAAFEVIRATFEQDAFTERAFREAADSARTRAGASAPRPSGSPTAPCSAAGPPTPRYERLAGRSPACSTRRCWRRCASASTSCSSPTPRPTTPPSTRRSSWSRRAGAPHASGLVNAVLRRAVRERAELTAALLGDDSTPERAAVAHSAPLWLAQMWWRSLARRWRGALLAACNEPAEVAVRASRRSRADRCLVARRGRRGSRLHRGLAAGRAGGDRRRGPQPARRCPASSPPAS